MYFGVDPWEFIEKQLTIYKNTPKMMTQLGMIINPMAPPVSPSIFKFFAHITAKFYKGRLKYVNLFSCSRDELTREFPIEFPVWREHGIEPIPYIMYTVSPKHTDEWYANYVREVATQFKPVRICVEDVGGLMTVERAKTFVPLVMESANGIPIELHLHGMGTFHQAVAVEAMKLGVRRFHTCIPPLANGSSMPSVYNVAHNARVLGLNPQINEEPLRIAEERLYKIAKEEGYVIGAPREYDERIYQHKVPGGVIANLEFQLKMLGLEHRIDEVLDDIAKMVVELGYPVMMTPHSQFVVTQATMNVSLGERYKEVIDAMIEYALGCYGVDDTGVNDLMDQNLKDKLLNHPNAKRIAEMWAQKEEEDAIDLSFDQLKAKYGVPGASDEQFWNHYWGLTEKQVVEWRRTAPPYKTYYFGKEPLMVLLNELKKHHDISRLELRKGDSFFDFRTK